MMYRQRRGEPAAAALSLGELLKPLSTVPQVRTGGHMKVNQDGVLLRVFIGESDALDGRRCTRPSSSVPGNWASPARRSSAAPRASAPTPSSTRLASWK